MGELAVDWEHFTPWASLTGGVLIGLGASVLLLFSGRIAGISGIIGGLLPPRQGDRGWRVAFVAGLAFSAFAANLSGYSPDPRFSSQNLFLVFLAGTAVGLGSRLGSGCTSGHGVCGLARCSVRSVVATACFMGAGMAVVFVLDPIGRGG
ncbi:YeeE/YedE family protein [Haematospirillum jordaniae]|uniref:YeeE/YedE family protein n=1 Tax=Haematospirillum jordaniae TaxID=1549855 RepID=UPI001FD75C72|nr:YeeE/YedE thiosulfate transporter family protein [Haematospirillum jordaniae]